MRKRKVRTFTLTDEVYAAIKENAEAEHLSMARYLERLIWSIQDKKEASK